MGLGEELTLLALARRRGDVRQDVGLAAALVVAHLVTLAGEGRIGLDGGRVVARDSAGQQVGMTGAVGGGTQAVAQDHVVGSASADPVFDQVRTAARGVTVRELIEHRAVHARVVHCVERLAANGVVRLVPDPANRGGSDTLIEVLDRSAIKAAAIRLRAIAAAGGQLSAEDVAFGALAQVAGLDRRVLSGPLRKRARARLARLADQHPTTRHEPDRTTRAIVRFGVQAVRASAALRARQDEAYSTAVPVEKQAGMNGVGLH